MNRTPTHSGPIPVPLRSTANGAAYPGWRVTHLGWAPHRLAFFLAIGVLCASAAWWLFIHLGRLGIGWSASSAVSPTETHAVVMTYGFFPLFFAGFLFTAGPKWLGLTAPTARSLLFPLLLQFAGWLGWLVGGAFSLPIAIAGGLLACSGWALTSLSFWGLVRKSRAPDRIHAKLVAWSCAAGSLLMTMSVYATSVDMTDWALMLARTGLWLFVVNVFLIVIHRMLPFFTSSALPLMNVWRPMWVLWFLMGVVALETVAIWIPDLLLIAGWQGDVSSRAWMLGQGLIEMAAGSAVLWLAVVWGLVQSLKVRMLAMLHTGFLWFGLALVLSGASQLLGIRYGTPVLGLGALHALNMGFLGSVLLAMVTRVSCGHSGRSLVADNSVWYLFLALQLATATRILSSLDHAPVWLNLAVATAWLFVMATWGWRLADWYGRPRADGKPD